MFRLIIHLFGQWRRAGSLLAAAKTCQFRPLPVRRAGRKEEKKGKNPRRTTLFNSNVSQLSLLMIGWPQARCGFTLPRLNEQGRYFRGGDQLSHTAPKTFRFNYVIVSCSFSARRVCYSANQSGAALIRRSALASFIQSPISTCCPGSLKTSSVIYCQGSAVGCRCCADFIQEFRLDFLLDSRITQEPRRVRVMFGIDLNEWSASAIALLTLLDVPFNVAP